MRFEEDEEEENEREEFLKEHEIKENYVKCPYSFVHMLRLSSFTVLLQWIH